jgi:AbiU2
MRDGYRQVFGTSPERIELLNRAAAMAFCVFQEVLFRDVELALNKLNDPPKRGRNATLKTLRNEIAALVDSQLAANLDALLTEYGNWCAKIKVRRNKSHAHFDYQSLTDQKVHPLPDINRSEIERALDTLRRFMNAIESPPSEI